MAATYWPNGLLNTLNSNLCNLPVWKYLPDGEGRVYTVSDSDSNIPVKSTQYNFASQPTSVTYGSLDSDSFNYDANTGRMTQFLAAVNGNVMSGAVNWNANGSLGNLNINDALNSKNTQTCTYAHDDLSRE